MERPLLEGIEGTLAAGEETEALATLAWLAGRDVQLDEGLLHGARRRAVLLLAAGGDPTRGLELEGRAVEALAGELDAPERRQELAHGLSRLGAEVSGLRLVSEALQLLLEDADLAWRALACALLAEELGAD